MIRTFDYLRTLPEVEAEVMGAVKRVLNSGRLILGPETEAFEREFAAFAGTKHCIGVSSGTEALHLALHALGIGPGDEVITVSNTCAPTVAAIRLTGATPVFVDVQESDLMMDADLLEGRITKQTKCILPVHLWGRASNLKSIDAIAQKDGLAVVEDCAQATGTTYFGKHVGTVGAFGCFSFYPTKNLGAYGDAGAIVTNDDALAEKARSARMYGYDSNAVSQIEGMNARISEIQAAILRIKLARFGDALKRRSEIAKAYFEGIASPGVSLPPTQEGVTPNYHQFVVRCADRSAVMDRLSAAEVGCAIHYPVPIHQMPAYAQFAPGSGDLSVTETAAGEILSIPFHEALTDAEVEKVCAAIRGSATR